MKDRGLLLLDFNQVWGDGTTISFYRVSALFQIFNYPRGYRRSGSSPSLWHTPESVPFDLYGQQGLSGRRLLHCICCGLPHWFFHPLYSLHSYMYCLLCMIVQLCKVHKIIVFSLCSIPSCIIVQSCVYSCHRKHRFSHPTIHQRFEERYTHEYQRFTDPCRAVQGGRPTD